MRAGSRGRFETMNRTDKQEQERLKAEYLRLLAVEVWKNDPKMLDYHRKTIARIIETKDVKYDLS